MKTAVRYYSKTGNTKKLADELANVLNVHAESVEKPLTEDVDILFLGNALYNNSVDKNIKKFLQDLNVNVKKVVSFGTSGTGKTTHKKLKRLLDKKGILLDKDEFFTKGHYVGHSRGLSSEINAGKPDDIDLENIRNFGRKYIN